MHVATEGEVTEPRYLASLGSSRVRVLAHPTAAGRSSPRRVLERLELKKQELRRLRQLQDGDEFWLMFDRDRWEAHDVREVCSSARRQGFQLAISNPCFELYLLLHFADPPFDDPHWSERVAACKSVREALEELIREHCGRRFPPGNELTARRDDAIRRAESMDTDRERDFPSRPGSRVYRLVRRVVDLETPPHVPPASTQQDT